LFKLSSKIKYAIIGFCDIYTSGKIKPVSLSDLVRRQKVPRPYMERIMSQLVKNRVLNSIKGAKGGFKINQRNKDITLFRIYEIFKGPEVSGDKTGKIGNEKSGIVLKNLELGIDKKMIELFKSIKLKDLHKVYNNKK